MNFGKRLKKYCVKDVYFDRIVNEINNYLLKVIWVVNENFWDFFRDVNC